jgi:hypothetical protein
VLRDLAAPDFQARNTAPDLSQIFSDLRRRNFDLYGAALLTPQLTAAPALDAEKQLRLTGFFPTRPHQINFDFSFQVVGGQWRLFGIAIATPQAPCQLRRRPQNRTRACRKIRELIFGLLTVARLNIYVAPPDRHMIISQGRLQV